MSEKTIGTCSMCGGAVTAPTLWMGVSPPTPSCRSCGALPAQSHGPVIPMEQPKPMGPPKPGPGNYSIRFDIGGRRWELPLVEFPQDSSG